MDNYESALKRLNGIFDKIQNGVISNPVKKGEGIPNKVKLERIKLKDKEYIQFSTFVDNKNIHENIAEADALEKILSVMQNGFKQAVIKGNNCATVLMNKKQEFKITGVKENVDFCYSAKEHNSTKNYILQNGVYVDWMYKLGLMDKDGNIHSHKQKKFRQINKFLEMLSDVEAQIPENSVIVDMGCGKSYLTFAMYHYFNIIKNKNIKIMGYDLKKDVVDYCNKLTKDFEFKNLRFYAQDIAEVDNDDKKISMIITLHACDIATDIAMYHGIRWNCKAIMSVPCCQHELMGQIKNETMDIMLKHGILKERFSALLTDSIRAEILEIAGYKTSVMEFIDMEHTPKNIMIRAVKRDNAKVDNNRVKKLEELIKAYNVNPYLYKLYFNQ